MMAAADRQDKRLLRLLEDDPPAEEQALADPRRWLEWGNWLWQWRQGNLEEKS